MEEGRSKMAEMIDKINWYPGHMKKTREIGRAHV